MVSGGTKILLSRKNFPKNILLIAEMFLDTLVVLFGRVEGKENAKEKSYLLQKANEHLVGRSPKK